MIEFIHHTIPNQQWESNTGNREYKRILNIGNDAEIQNDIKKNKLKQSDNICINYMKELKLTNKINRRASQLQYRLIEGQGKAIYLIGVEDNGNVDGISMINLMESINFLCKMIEIVNAKIDKIRIYYGNLENKYICTARIKLPNYIPEKYNSI